ncbi:DUF1616 domain-containing protein [Candidatus Gracilibacteria bacterium]|nr:DUF1616 domain-containing protein [Candidatus Gracilibacteria bacterium]
MPYQDSIFLQWLRIITGSIFLLFIPGLLLVQAFFDKKEVDFLERMTLSFALSLSVVPLLVFYASYIGMKISALNVFAVVFHFILALCVYILFFQKLSPGVGGK